MSHSQPTGQWLSVNDLPVVREELNDVRAKWYDVGMQLRVSVATLDAIKKLYNDPSDCLMETLKTWLKTYPSPTWSNIVDSLGSSVVDEVRLADNLERKYCSAQHTSIAATRPVPVQPTTPQHPATAVTQLSVLPPPIPSAIPTPLPEIPATTQCATVSTPPHHPPQGISIIVSLVPRLKRGRAWYVYNMCDVKGRVM